MDIQRIDHANLCTTQLDVMVAWYRDVLGFEAGWRPDFAMGGAWLYRHGNPIIHLVDVEKLGDNKDLRIEHVAFAATGKSAFRAHLKALGIACTEVDVPDTAITQFNVHDPDGNHLHIDFIGES